MTYKLGLSKKQIMMLISTVVFNFLIYNGGRMLSQNLKHYSLATAWDAQIPFIPWTILIYWGCYLFWVVNYYLGVKFDKGNGRCFIGAHFIGEAICFLFFLLLPTTMVRADNPGTSITEWLVLLTYQNDAADNLFPSIHCFVSWLCWIGVRINRNIPKWYQFVSLICAIAVCISTLTVKQHVIADVPAGIILAEFCYRISAKWDSSCIIDKR